MRIRDFFPPILTDRMKCIQIEVRMKCRVKRFDPRTMSLERGENPYLYFEIFAKVYRIESQSNWKKSSKKLVWENNFEEARCSRSPNLLLVPFIFTLFIQAPWLLAQACKIYFDQSKICVSHAASYSCLVQWIVGKRVRFFRRASASRLHCHRIYAEQSWSEWNRM